MHQCAWLVALVLIASPANARSRTTFFHRVDLRTGAATKLVEVEAGQPNLRVRDPVPAGWWKVAPGGRPPSVTVTLDQQFDPRQSDVEKAWETRALVVSADGIPRLRLPSPDRYGEIRSYVHEGDMLLVAWSSRARRVRMGIDLAQGRVVWRRPVTDPGWEYAHATGSSRVFIRNEHAFEAVDVTTGSQVWRLPRNDRELGSYLEICQLSGPQWVLGGKEIIALDAGTGKVVWRTTISVPKSDRPYAAGLPRWCVAQANRIFVAWRTGIGSGTERDILAALDAADGRIIWRNPPAAMIAQGIAVGDDALATWSPGGIARVDRDDGRTLWTLAGVGPTAIETLANGDWFVPRGGCLRLDPRTGAVRWKLGVSCARLGEATLLASAVTERGERGATIVLRRFSFDRQKLLREDVVHRYPHWFEIGGSEVVDVTADAAVVMSDFGTLD
jgi:outer membrane protein assembly factor BamB